MIEELRSRVIRMEELSSFRDEHRGDRVVFTNGCFDLIHVGHVMLLKEAKSFGDILVVGLNSDDSVRRIKGEPRPFVPQDERAEILLSLKPVDFVVIFDEDTPVEVIRALRPDVLVKGAEYEKEDIVGADFVESYGGMVERIDMIEGRSTTGIIRRIRNGLDKPG